MTLFDKSVQIIWTYFDISKYMFQLHADVICVFYRVIKAITIDSVILYYQGILKRELRTRVFK